MENVIKSIPGINLYLCVSHASISNSMFTLLNFSSPRCILIDKQILFLFSFWFVGEKLCTRYFLGKKKYVKQFSILINNSEMPYVVFLMPPQGARGFPGAPGLPGLKGHRVSSILCNLFRYCGLPSRVWGALP